MKVVLAKDYLFHLSHISQVAFTAMLAFVKRPVVFMERVNLWLLCVFGRIGVGNTSGYRARRQPFMHGIRLRIK